LRNDFYIISPIKNTFVFYGWLDGAIERGLIVDAFEPRVARDKITLNGGSVRIMTVPNAGGSSVYSEAVSFEILSSCFCNVKLEKTEMELEYMAGSKITDYSIRIKDHIFGVSVTRAMKYGEGTFSTEDAKRLLDKKLHGIIASTHGVIKQHRWKKQILHIWAQEPYIAKVLMDTYEKHVSDELKSNTLVYITVTNRNAQWIFFE